MILCFVLTNAIHHPGPPRQSGRSQRVNKPTTHPSITLSTIPSAHFIFQLTNEIPSIAKSAGTLILSSGGIIRGFTNWGPFLLPRKARVHQQTHEKGHYFIMRFDSSGYAQTELRRILALDPRMIRFGVVKLGKTFEEMAKVDGGGIPWRTVKNGAPTLIRTFQGVGAA